MPAATMNPDPLLTIPDPDVIRVQLADAVRRRDLLRSLLRVAVRKASYDCPDSPETTGVRDDG